MTTFMGTFIMHITRRQTLHCPRNKDELALLSCSNELQSEIISFQEILLESRQPSVSNIIEIHMFPEESHPNSKVSESISVYKCCSSNDLSYWPWSSFKHYNIVPYHIQQTFVFSPLLIDNALVSAQGLNLSPPP